MSTRPRTSQNSMTVKQADVSTIRARLARYTPDIEKKTASIAVDGASYRPEPDNFPVPELVLVALRLLGLAWFGPEEKCRWTVEFTYLGKPASVSLRKFGFTITLDGALTISDRKRLEGQLRKAAQTVEAWLQPLAKTAILEGDFLIANRYSEFDARYRFFRAAADASFKRAPQIAQTGEKIKARRSVKLRPKEEAISFSLADHLNHMIRHQHAGFFNATAMVESFFSRLEHQTILLIAFMPSERAEAISLRMTKKWDDKLKDIFEVEKDKNLKRIYAELKSLKERIRNPSAHGGVENDMGWMQIHIPGIGNLPANFSRIRHSARFKSSPIDEEAYTTICELFDRYDEFVAAGATRRAQMLIDAGVDPSCDGDTKQAYTEAMKSDTAIDEFIDRWSDNWSRHVNMDY